MLQVLNLPFKYWKLYIGVVCVFLWEYNHQCYFYTIVRVLVTAFIKRTINEYFALRSVRCFILKHFGTNVNCNKYNLCYGIFAKKLNHIRLNAVYLGKRCQMLVLMLECVRQVFSSPNSHSIWITKTPKFCTLNSLWFLLLFMSLLFGVYVVFSCVKLLCTILMEEKSGSFGGFEFDAWFFFISLHIHI